MSEISKTPPGSARDNTQRIAKLLARAGVASRREIERMIAEGRVALNGKVLDTPATLLKSLHGVTVDGQPVQAPAPARLFVYHKPSGLLVTEHDPKGRPTIYDKLPKDLPRVVPVGRLDLNTEGLLLLTTDGELKRQLELPSSGVERVYRARAYGQVTQAQLEDLIEGVEIDGVRYGQIDANLERRTGANVWIEVRLTEGKNREVRRVLEHLGLKVSRLIRLAYGPFVLGDMPIGEVGEIRQHDLVAFRKSLSGRRRGDDAAAPVEAGPRKNRRQEADEAAEGPEKPSRARGPASRSQSPRTRSADGAPGDARPFRKGRPPRADAVESGGNTRPQRGSPRRAGDVEGGDKARPSRGRPQRTSDPASSDHARPQRVRPQRSGDFDGKDNARSQRSRPQRSDDFERGDKSRPQRGRTQRPGDFENNDKADPQRGRPRSEKTRDDYRGEESARGRPTGNRNDQRTRTDRPETGRTGKPTTSRERPGTSRPGGGKPRGPHSGGGKRK